MSSSQRKKERRRMRYERNVRKEIEHKQEAWAAGKLLEENHNGGPYSSGYCEELAQRLVDRIEAGRLRAPNPPTVKPDGTPIETPFTPNEYFHHHFGKYRMKTRDLILHWNPSLPKNANYRYLKNAIETYWDHPDSILQKVSEYVSRGVGPSRT